MVLEPGIKNSKMLIRSFGQGSMGMEKDRAMDTDVEKGRAIGTDVEKESKNS